MKVAKLPRLTERQFQDQVARLARLRGWRVAHFRPAMTRLGKWVTAVQYDAKGFPDMVLLRGTRILFRELKVSGRKATSEQVQWLLALRDAKQDAALWTPDDWLEIQETLA
jgi:hypothetical protein